LDRLQANPETAEIAVLNQGIGGNRLLREGLGPSALARLDRDVIAQSGVRWLIVFEGINDLGTAVGARSRGKPAATAQDIIFCYAQIILRAHSHGIRVYGGTILPCGESFYDDPTLEADRQTINEWIRTSGKFDAVIDFDVAIRDPENPSRLFEPYDVGDHLHLNPAGYKAMAETIDPGLFTKHAGH
jgi:lysophospholipase L1-like esterase